MTALIPPSTHPYEASAGRGAAAPAARGAAPPVAAGPAVRHHLRTR